MTQGVRKNVVYGLVSEKLSYQYILSVSISKGVGGCKSQLLPRGHVLTPFDAL